MSVLFLLSALLPAPLPLAQLLADSRAGGATGQVHYQAPGPLRRSFERALLTLVFNAARRDDSDAVRRLSFPALALGFRLVLTTDLGDPVVVVLERDEARRGAGIYVARMGPARREAYVQAPHRFSDRGTEELALAVFRATDARALGMNTVHRRGRSGVVLAAADDDTPPPRGNADVAHDVESTFQLATQAWLAGAPQGAILQLHGFADVRVPADVVLSAGHGGTPPAWVETTKTALLAALPDARVAGFPADVQALGATANAQAQVARAVGARFVHVEISASLRRRLLGAPRLVDALVRGLTPCLAEREDEP